jgi:hypothetical protein
MDQTEPAFKAFYGTSENAVKTQVWIAITMYALAAIVKKRMNLKAPLSKSSADFSNPFVRENTFAGSTL